MSGRQVQFGMRRLGAWMLPALLALLAALPGTLLAEALAGIDFAEGGAYNLEIVGEAPTVVEYAGGRFAKLSPTPVSQPLEWPADMPNPGFPGVTDPAGRRARIEAPSLVLATRNLSGVAAGPVALVITVYDTTESNRSNNSITLSWLGAEKGGSGRFQLSGNPYSKDPIFQPRLVRKMVVADGMSFDNALEGGFLKLEAPTTLYVQRIELYLLPNREEAMGNLARHPLLAAYGEYASSENLLEIWRQDVSDLMVEQAKVYAHRVEAEDAGRALLRLMEREPTRVRGLPAGREIEQGIAELAAVVERSALAADRFYYDGRFALVVGDWSCYAAVLSESLESLAKSWEAAELLLASSIGGFARLKSVPGLFQGEGTISEVAPRGPAGAPSFRERVLFTAFANSPWEDRDPYNANGRYLSIFGVETMGYLGGSLAVDEEGKPVAAGLAHLRNRLRNLRANGWDVAPLVGHHEHHVTSLSWAPAWLKKKSADGLWDVDAKGNERKYLWNIWNPDAAAYFHRSIGALAGELKDKPYIQKLYCWTELNGGTGYSQSARSAFRRYLEERYGSIESLNASWGAEYGSFAAIEPPPPAGEVLRTQASGLTYTFEAFRRESFTQWWVEAKKHLKEADPEASMWLEGWGRYDYLPRHGMDQLALFDAADIAGVHTGSLGQDAQRMWQLALSKYSGTPISDGEVNIYGPYYGGFVGMEELRAAAEQHLLLQTFYNVRLFMFWGSQISMFRAYSYGGPYLYDSDFVSPVSSSGAALRIVRQKSDLYDSVIRKTQVVDAQVGLLYSPTTFINSWPYNEFEHEMLPMHGWFYHSDYGYRVVHEDAIGDGREDLYSLRVLIAPWAAWLKPDVATEIAEWVKRGGILISSGPVGAFDEYGRPLKTLLQEALGEVTFSYGGHERLTENRLSSDSIDYLRSLGDYASSHFGGWFWKVEGAEEPKARVDLSLADGTPIVYEGRLGKGKVLVATGPLGKNGLRQYVLNQVAQRVTPLVRKTLDDGFHVVPRRDLHGRLYLAVVNQSVRDTLEEKLTVEGRYRQVTERTLYGDWRVPVELEEGATIIRLRLAPGEGTILMLGHAELVGSGSVTPRQAREAGQSGWSHGEWEMAKARLEGGRLSAPVRAEALALMSASLQAASMGYYERAGLLMEKAVGLRGFTAPFAYPQDRVEAIRATTGVTIDGVAEEWRHVPRYSVKGTESSGGDFAFQWDDEHLYLLVIARDETPRRTEELGGDFNWVWNYDGINLVINAANTAPLTVGGALYDAKYNAGQNALLVSITGRKYGTGPSGFSAASVRSAVREIDGGYTMEVAIPLRDILVAPLAGADVGFNLDLINSGRRQGFAFSSDREDWQWNALNFARLILSAGAGEPSTGAAQ